jgi:hypothetical protein
LKKNPFKKKRLKNIRIWTNKLNIIIGFGFEAKLKALGSGVAARPNNFGLIFF